jgi:hypothetical protein
VLEDPFVGDDVGTNGAIDRILGVVGDQGSKFFFYDASLVWINEGGTDASGYWRQGQYQSGRQGGFVGQ